MGGLIKLIKNLFGGIFSFLGGLIGGKKSIEGSAPKTRKSSGYFLELDEAESIKKPTVSTPAATPVATLSKAAPAASNGSVAVAEKPRAIAAVAVAQKPAASPEFATKYLVPTTNGSRRRPGANMNSYLDMARGMKSN